MKIGTAHKTKAKITVKPIEPATLSFTIASGCSANMLKTKSVIGDMIHKNVAIAIRQDVFFLCSIYAFASYIEIFLTFVSNKSFANSLSSISSFNR